MWELLIPNNQKDYQVCLFFLNLCKSNHINGLQFTFCVQKLTKRRLLNFNNLEHYRFDHCYAAGSMLFICESIGINEEESTSEKSSIFTLYFSVKQDLSLLYWWTTSFNAFIGELISRH